MSVPSDLGDGAARLKAATPTVIAPISPQTSLAEPLRFMGTWPRPQQSGESLGDRLPQTRVVPVGQGAHRTGGVARER